MAADPIARLVQQLAKLPGIGEKTATRLAFFVLRAPEAFARELAAALVDVKEKIRLCSVCLNLTEQDPCALCSDVRRDRRSSAWWPPDGPVRNRAHRRLPRPLPRAARRAVAARRHRPRRHAPARAAGAAARGDIEVIVATSPNVEGEATALYMAKVLKPLGVRVSRIAAGVPIGGELEYADGVTISRALEGRRDM